MGMADFCVNFCWVIGLVGVFFLSILAIQVNSGNEVLLPDPQYKSNVTTHLVIAVVVIILHYHSDQQLCIVMVIVCHLIYCKMYVPPPQRPLRPQENVAPHVAPHEEEEQQRPNSNEDLVAQLNVNRNSMMVMLQCKELERDYICYC